MTAVRMARLHPPDASDYRVTPVRTDSAESLRTVVARGTGRDRTGCARKKRRRTKGERQYMTMWSSHARCVGATHRQARENAREFAQWSPEINHAEGSPTECVHHTTMWLTALGVRTSPPLTSPDDTMRRRTERSARRLRRSSTRDRRTPTPDIRHTSTTRSDAKLDTRMVQVRRHEVHVGGCYDEASLLTAAVSVLWSGCGVQLLAHCSSAVRTAAGESERCSHPLATCASGQPRRW
jgi:hypothetical protein